MTIDELKRVFEESTDMGFPEKESNAYLSQEQLYRLAHAIRRDYLLQFFEKAYVADPNK